VSADDAPAELPGVTTIDHGLSLEAVRRRSRRLAWTFVAAAVLLIPWTVYLAVTLPKRDVDTHYRGAWVGFDLFLVLAIVLTAYYAFRVDTRIQLTATATATLLLVDAWFDVMTAGGRKATASAVVMALVVEIPAAIFFMWLARRVNHNADRMALAAHGHSPDDGHHP